MHAGIRGEPCKAYRVKLSLLKHAGIHGGSCKVYRVKLSLLKQKILMNIQLGVICVDMVDYCKHLHIY